MYIATYPLTQRINPMRKLLLTTAAVAVEKIILIKLAFGLGMQYIKKGGLAA
jgi:hypothetical protein